MRIVLRLLLTLVLIGNSSFSFANEDEFLPVNEAFKVQGVEDGSYVVFRYQIADGYYLYKDRFQFGITEGGSGELGEPVFQQAAKWKEDPIFGQVEVFYSQVNIYLPVLNTDGGFVEIDAGYQGCADKGLCYIPQTYTNMYQVDTQAPAPEINPQPSPPQPVTGDDPGEHSVAPPSLAPSTAATLDTSDALSLETFLSGNGLFSILGVFFLIGIGLTFTPCVLPMVPILSGIIVGQGPELSRSKAATLSFTYVTGMALTYAALGVVAGVSGARLPVALQNPTILFSFAALFVVLSLSMFGFYEMQLPSALQNRFNDISNKQKSGTYIGVAVIGILSALLVSPCVSAPLAGALLYIGQSGDWLLGGFALLALGYGMGVPLLVIGITGANILPKAGGWMDNVKGLFGAMLLAVALWLVKHLMPAVLAWTLAGGLLILVGLYLGALDPLQSPKGKLFKAIGLSALICGAGLILNSVISPVTTVDNRAETQTLAVPFESVRSEAELDRLLAEARSNNQPVIVDYFAEWCTACYEMEHETFTQADVQARLKQHRWVQIDLTNNPEDDALLNRYQLPGPPAILFFDADGKELSQARIYAYKSKPQFLLHLEKYKI
ncbi:protein-disulfide reductase DsbD [Ketobacter sp. MCCC 1A13808]|uniref:protein-disulfide reductase DsbD n=1 Tax=Ketobacter sp. MCCC 1A13808 TaxID=2602738 RepID=UPI0012ECB59B|nr:protein-disulfide reductase DsbD [Ketobacter sp. MCCC 1A13808]MVF11362.1 protein-disulfide reductase DsbD [Ketobacter sp. MCCC 1A13808]